ncbi:short-chain dehydrogenase reductase 3b [Amborella trichopoda]|uniref:short-chain dehydrogenase reductase 3b n=1 Tax=Amborella trichopoda TaxID=13333 RepID=UPI0005D45E11|nr:short-chain dehydrogenase reductase 3b [Amborella trichopoda]|eukprot:XP_011622371.1 short-chain dehydrogenase reductase 3b [Amborella trichopoda]
MSTLRLGAKVTIITGAASGISEAAARLFVKNGARVVSVVIADVQDKLGHDVVSSIGENHSSYRHCDVTDENQVKETIDFTLSKYGGLDIMFSNAGFLGQIMSIMDMDMGELDTIMAINLRGAASTMKHASRAMVERGVRGSIICTTSVSDSLGGLAPHSYTASKHALLGLVRSASSELGKHGIRVNCVSPYGVATSLACGLTGVSSDEMEAMTSAVSNLKGIILKPRHIAEAAIFLASDESALVSGHNLVVDGGFSVVNHSFPLFR